MSARAESVRQLAETIDLPPHLRAELACFALQVDEPWEDVLAEALSELRTLRGVCCDQPECCLEESSTLQLATNRQPVAL